MTTQSSVSNFVIKWHLFEWSLVRTGCSCEISMCLQFWGKLQTYWDVNSQPAKPTSLSGLWTNLIKKNLSRFSQKTWPMNMKSFVFLVLTGRAQQHSPWQNAEFLNGVWCSKGAVVFVKAFINHLSNKMVSQARHKHYVDNSDWLAESRRFIGWKH